MKKVTYHWLSLDQRLLEKLKEFLPAAANFYNPVDVLGRCWCR
ncbi:MAG: hypothetical protein U5N58_00420 [Actinomycetota bacterium]|nr:hypothetical protein [Actinomycetota bacterium]